MASGHSEARNAGRGIQQLLQVSAGGRRCALPLGQVREVLRPLPLQPIPELPDYVAGLTVLRGHPVPVVDLSSWLGLARGEVGRWLHLVQGARRLALAVEAVDGVREIEGAEWEAMPCLLRDRDAESALSRFGEVDGQLLSLVEAARLLPETAWAKLEAAS
ncbi:chemotaxis protein CheW [Pseudomarimonas salicorniae]|uniref:Chemotaxis protein CheW n=1 Tax=Pseudomarimonas salicorniae TaxID=2933270 RepID=A0ABT0GFP7_9GAMM|nr:chemotaxis protein CheW [Lysobacter sp. CAU 1642]MCK7593364.1 chemotaxis protein CheW [Lysobacter sp. CAU 1642]